MAYTTKSSRYPETGASQVTPYDKNMNSNMNMVCSDIDIESDAKVIEFERILRSCCPINDDPMIYWIQYTNYIKTSFPANKHFLITTYNKCVQSLMDYPRYKNDQRFVRVCIIHADRCVRPLLQFQHLYKKKVGVCTGMFWMAWAWIAEKKGEVQLTETIFRKALERKIEPVKVVRQRFHAFRKRLDRKRNGKGSVGSDGGGCGDVEESNGCDRGHSNGHGYGHGHGHGHCHAKSHLESARLLVEASKKNDKVLIHPQKRMGDAVEKEKQAKDRFKKSNDYVVRNNKVDWNVLPISSEKHAHVPRGLKLKSKPKEWVQPRLVDISNASSSPFMKRYPIHKKQRKRQRRHGHNFEFGFDVNLLVEDRGVESCFERERAKVCQQVSSSYEQGNFNRLSIRSACDIDVDIDVNTAALQYEEEHPSDNLDYESLHKNDVESALALVLQGKSATSSIKEDGVPVNVMLDQKTPRCLTTITKKINTLKFDGVDYNIMHKLGAGTFGTVLLCEAKVEGEQLGKKNSRKFALKVQRPARCLAWEFLVLQKLQYRLSERYPTEGVEQSNWAAIPKAYSFNMFSDGGVLRITAGSCSGLNLLDIVNFHKGNVPELLAIHYTHRMMVHMEVLHLEGKFLHCDIKPDNWIISSHPENTSDIMLIDFGRAKDLKILTNGSKIKKMDGQVATEGLECIAMRQGKSWSVDIDTYGLCVCAHTLLFGSYMDVVQKEGKWKLKKPLRRYWQTPLWRLFFECFINETSPDLKEYEAILKGIKIAFGTHVEGRSRELKQLLLHQNSELPQRK